MPTDRDRLAALLAHHADVVAARWDSVAPGAGAWEVAAAHSLRGHAAALVADEETPAVRELLDSILAFEAEHPAAPSAPADTIGLCGYCGVPRETHHHGYVSTAATLAAAPHRITADEAALITRIEGAKKQAAEEEQRAETAPESKGLRLLSTPCASCEHPYNWHAPGVCQVNECGCIAFAEEARP